MQDVAFSAVYDYIHRSANMFKGQEQKLNFTYVVAIMLQVNIAGSWHYYSPNNQ